MAEIIGDYIGTTFDDFLVLPGLNENRNFTPEDVDISGDICGVHLRVPFFTAAMRSVTGKELALAAGKAGIMGVAPRGLSIEKEVDIVQYVNDHEVRVGEIESQERPVTIDNEKTLGDALKLTKEYGHSNIPVVDRLMNFMGMFSYNPSVHDKLDRQKPITEIMQPVEESNDNGICYEDMSDDEIKNRLMGTKKRFMPVLDKSKRLAKIVFIQHEEAYKVGAAIDTHKGWKERAHAVIEAGADMIFIDTSDAYKPFSADVVKEYKNEFPNGPPICAGNIVTADAFDYLVDAGADAVKVGMGPGSICSTNEVLGIGAPPFWALVEISRRRDERKAKGERYVPVIVDGGIRSTDNITVAMTHADGLMGGRIFGCFEESAGEKGVDNYGRPCIRIFGEASQEAYETTGNMHRYSTPNEPDAPTSFQGVSGWIPYEGRFKPGLEVHKKTLREAVYHAGCDGLKRLREKAVLIRLSERAKQIAKPHDISIVGD